MARAKNAALIVSRAGRPNDTLDTPRTLLYPFSRNRRKASSVTNAARGSELTVIANGSKIRSFTPMPYFFASATIFSATASRPCAVAGMPCSSNVSATTSPPYLATSGKTASMLSLVPLTELTMALPLYNRKAPASASREVVSSCKGRSLTPCNRTATVRKVSASSMSGSPTLTSRISAPSSCCLTPSRRT